MLMRAIYVRYPSPNWLKAKKHKNLLVKLLLLSTEAY